MNSSSSLCPCSCLSSPAHAHITKQDITMNAILHVEGSPLSPLDAITADVTGHKFITQLVSPKYWQFTLQSKFSFLCHSLETTHNNCIMLAISSTLLQIINLQKVTSKNSCQLAPSFMWLKNLISLHLLRKKYKLG